jgi:hypothetical protein
MMPIGMDRDHGTPGRIARNALLSAGRNRGQSGTKSERSEAHRECETHGFSFSLILFVYSRNILEQPANQAIPQAFGSAPPISCLRHRAEVPSGPKRKAPAAGLGRRGVRFHAVGLLQWPVSPAEKPSETERNDDCGVRLVLDRIANHVFKREGGFS